MGAERSSDDAARRSAEIPVDLDRLPSMPIAELRHLWAEHMGRAKPPSQKRLLSRELAWRLQERVYGGLDAETRRLLNRAVRAAKSGAPAARDIGNLDTPDSKRRKRRPRGAACKARASARDLPPAARLVRTWHGVTYEVYVLDGGQRFRYRDRTYKSLSEVARQITGTHWSGPRFFGLTTRAVGDGDDARSGGRAKRRRGGASP